MRKDESAEKRAARERFERSLGEMEVAAAEIVEVGDALFRHGVPADPTLLHRYRLYNRVKAALALPPGALTSHAAFAASPGHASPPAGGTSSAQVVARPHSMLASTETPKADVSWGKFAGSYDRLAVLTKKFQTAGMASVPSAPRDRRTPQTLIARAPQLR